MSVGSTKDVTTHSMSLSQPMADHPTSTSFALKTPAAKKILLAKKASATDRHGIGLQRQPQSEKVGSTYEAELERLQSRLENDVFSAILVDQDDEDDEDQKHRLLRLLETNIAQLLLLVITFYSLFFDDYQALLCGKQLDVVFDAFSITFMCCFAIELVISSLFLKNYFNSYFFYLDLISTLSIIIDLNMFKEAINTSFASGSDSIAKVGKLVRLVRLIRLFRISRIYKSFSKSKTNVRKKRLRTSLKLSSKVLEMVLEQEEPKAKPEVAKTASKSIRQVSSWLGGNKTDSKPAAAVKPHDKDSKVGKKISEVATKTVILMVFILLILLPIFNADFWTNSDSSGGYLCNQLGMIMQASFAKPANLSSFAYAESLAKIDYSDQAMTMALLTKTVRDNMGSQGLGGLLRVRIQGNDRDYFHESSYPTKRYEEMVISTCKVGGLDIAVYEDDSQNALLSAGLNILRTVYICFILIGGSYLFKYYAQTLVITPIERMIEKAANVIRRPQEVKEEAFIEQEAKEYKAYMDRVEGKQREEDNKDEGENLQLETMFLEEAISKISVLLGVGLGDAGSELIYNYLKNEKDILNIASRIDAIFGFCDIRNFTDATEVLQEEVMIFVNTIADIVHSLADMCLGAANKNVGDAFLVVWRIRPEDSMPIFQNAVEDGIVWNNMADLALYSVLIMHAEIGRSFSLKRFIDNPDMQVRIGKNFKIRLGFGLHFGWAIEGALGSLFKIDATYLSPNVNMAARLEGDTKMYGVPILLSGEFFDKLSLPIKSFCRQVDAVRDSAHGHTLRLFTPLITDKFIKYTQSQPIEKHILKTQERSNFKKVIRADIHVGRLLGKRLFQNDKDISLLTSGVDSHLVRFFRNGYDEFTYGNWAAAKKNFEGVLEIDPKDGPSIFLLDYMKEFVYQQPDWWSGYRIQEGGSGH